jgi:KDO2-lipid IV(A) lauroyltransferase
MRVRYGLEYAAYRLFGAIVQRLPRATAHRLAARLGSLVFERGGRRTRRTLANLRIAYPDLPEERRREIGRRSFENFAINGIDWLRSESWTPEELRARVEVRGEEHLHAALAGGRGALILTLHLGNFEIAASVPPLWGFEFSVTDSCTGASSRAGSARGLTSSTGAVPCAGCSARSARDISSVS